MELEFVRTFVAVVDGGRFQEAAAGLGVSQQAVSKRVVALERELGVRLFTRTARGAALTGDGVAFLPHARELLAAGERAVAAVRPGRRPLRVDVLNRRIKVAELVRQFHLDHPDVQLDIVTLGDDTAASVAAIAEGGVDATFRAVPAGELPEGVVSTWVYDEPHELLVGPRHALAEHGAVSLRELADHRVWMPDMSPDTEWGGYYRELAARFGLTIDVDGPNFGNEAMLDEIAASAELATFVGEGSRYFWPEHYDLRRIPVVDPAPLYPHFLVWRRKHPHPALGQLREHLVPDRGSRRTRGVWLPDWGQTGIRADSPGVSAP
ncbi:LysR family transcriptional regulator [Amycolatopsis sp. NPDC051903]|uniref:LysR family transcriptional regulator n=1 Tax=Amycolatopsis sp. NPDC051903 TaxID=3363936 RepID=UPI0037A20F4D